MHSLQLLAKFSASPLKRIVVDSGGSCPPFSVIPLGAIRAPDLGRDAAGRVASTKALCSATSERSDGFPVTRDGRRERAASAGECVPSFTSRRAWAVALPSPLPGHRLPSTVGGRRGQICHFVHPQSWNFKPGIMILLEKRKNMMIC